MTETEAPPPKKTLKVPISRRQLLAAAVTAPPAYVVGRLLGGRIRDSIIKESNDPQTQETKSPEYIVSVAEVVGKLEEIQNEYFDENNHPIAQNRPSTQEKQKATDLAGALFLSDPAAYNDARVDVSNGARKRGLIITANAERDSWVLYDSKDGRTTMLDKKLGTDQIDELNFSEIFSDSGPNEIGLIINVRQGEESPVGGALSIYLDNKGYRDKVSLSVNKSDTDRYSILRKRSSDGTVSYEYREWGDQVDRSIEFTNGEISRTQGEDAEALVEEFDRAYTLFKANLLLPDQVVV